MTSQYEQITKGIKGLFFVSLFCAGIGSCRNLCCSKLRSTEYADKTPEVREFTSFGMSTHHTKGFYLTIEESRRREDNGRQINFLDYGFDGKLDRVKIEQDERRGVVVTNQTELLKWQPIFEQMRLRRFGDYEKCDKSFN
jgi:hypothetical protein